MRVASLLTSTLACLGAVTAQKNASECPEGVGTDPEGLLPNTWSRIKGFASHDRHREMADRMEKRGTGQPFVPYSTQHGQCLDVQNNNLNSGSKLQLWQCSGGNNQAWRIEGPLFQTNNDMCLDVPNGNAYNGAQLQVWKCNGQNPNQMWNQVGSTLRWNGGGGAGYCLDVTNGNFQNGNMMQLWNCYAGSANQAFTQGSGAATGSAPTTGSSGTGATNFDGYNCISLDDFVNKYSACAPYKGALQSAGADQGINPTFLGAIAMVESGCQPVPPGPNGKYGPFQFMDNNAWNFYGGSGKDRTNFWDAAYGAARYFKALLNQDNNNLYQVMRDWNGPVSQGGDPNYQNMAAGYMGGYA